MAVGRDARAECLVAHLGRPRLRIGDEEALVAGEAVDHRGFLAVQRSAIRVIRRLKSRDVGDILTQRQLAVHREIGERSEEHTSELQSLMRISYAVFCLQKKNKNTNTTTSKRLT